MFEPKFETANAATMLFIRRMRCFNKSYSVFLSFGNGHSIVRDQDGLLVYVVFKRDWYNTFCIKYASHCESAGIVGTLGESINVSAVNRALAFGCERIYFVHKEGIFFATPLQIKKYCEFFELRDFSDKSFAQRIKTYDGKVYELREEKYNFPKTLLEELEWALEKNM